MPDKIYIQPKTNEEMVALANRLRKVWDERLERLTNSSQYDAVVELATESYNENHYMWPTETPLEVEFCWEEGGEFIIHFSAPWGLVLRKDGTYYWKNMRGEGDGVA